jgi:hypothetical protein
MQQLICESPVAIGLCYGQELNHGESSLRIVVWVALRLGRTKYETSLKFELPYPSVIAGTL